MKKVAIPLNGDQLSAHFGHCEHFGVFDIEDDQIIGKNFEPSPPHEPGLLPRWLAEKGVNEIIAGGMGQRAIQLFEQQKIGVIVGVNPQQDYQAILEQYLSKGIEAGENCCDH